MESTNPTTPVGTTKKISTTPFDGCLSFHSEEGNNDFKKFLNNTLFEDTDHYETIMMVDLLMQFNDKNSLIQLLNIETIPRIIKIYIASYFARFHPWDGANREMVSKLLLCWIIEDNLDH